MASLNYFDKDKQEWVAIPLGGGGDSSVSQHDDPLPQPAVPTPQGIEDAYAKYADGLHYFKQAGAVVSIVRDGLQTSIVISGQVRSVVRIVKSDAGLPTPDNPSTFLNSTPDGKWMLLSADQLDAPFENPQTVDLFKPNMSGYATVDDLALKADKLNLAEAVANNLAASEPNVLSNWMRLIITSPDFQTSVPALDHGHVMQDIPGLYSSLENMYVKTQVDEKLDLKSDKSDTYTKKEVDDAREADKDFSIANDNVLLASITSLQEIVSNLGEVGTGQMDVLAAIKDVEIEPSSIKLTGDAASPIAWKGGLSLAPVQDGGDWRLGWNDGKQVHALFHSSDFTIENINTVIGGETIEVSGLNVTNGILNFQADFSLARDGSRLAVQEGSGPIERVAYLSDLAAIPAPQAQDLSGYAKLADPAQMLTAKSVLAEGFAFTTVNVLKIHDTGEGYGPRLSYITPDGPSLKIDPICLKSDLEPLETITDDVANLKTLVSGLSGGWKNMAMINGYLAGTPAPQYRVVGDTFEFRGQVKSPAVLPVDTFVNFSAVEDADKPSINAFALISSSTAFATFKLGISRVLQICPRLLPSDTFDLNARFVGGK